MRNLLYIIFILIINGTACSQNTSNGEKNHDDMKFKKLTTDEERVIVHKGTEAPFTGEFDDFYEKGTYECKRCGAELYRSTDKFKSGCGWPSFDDEIDGAVKRVPDADGRRTEILCAGCGAHLGHVFTGEGYTRKDIRHCVNSISLEFVPEKPDKDSDTRTAIFAGGCFWGVEHYLLKEPGVLSTEPGYTGGYTEHPTYEEVCKHNTGHAEAVKVVYDPEKTDYEKIARLFFEIHDPTQVNRQGPDIGDQYRSEVFYLNMEQKRTAEKLVSLLEQKGYDVATRITRASTFWPAEDYHQQYYEKKNGTPYCHVYTKRF